MIKSVLIANRGEIACRIIRTAKSLGIHTVIVYSEADAQSLAVQEADESYYLGPAQASESYLNTGKIIEIAKKSKVEAIHPGYGFLSENADFAKACLENDIIFIGPSLKALETMGSKHNAKAFVRKLKIPLIPGFEGVQSNLDREAKNLGFPLLIKAAFGGGGKGMRLVNAQDQFTEALEACQREALSAFGNGEVILEKVIPSPRHIEVQIFGDRFGNIVHLFERDCSLQRRYQKVIEEAPSNLPSKIKEKMFEAATRIGKELPYEGAGTVEFLVDPEHHFYFMEMNTRLQVEHPITEAITGLDLVEWQFRVASGEELPLTQKEISSQGHAIELRLFAENPHENFKPQAGSIWFKDQPLNARIDIGLKTIDTVQPFYDPLLAKLIVKGTHREAAIGQARKALKEWIILGLKTNQPYLKHLLTNPLFVQNQFDINTLNSVKSPPKSIPEFIYSGASLIKALSHYPTDSPWNQEDKWHLEGYFPFTFLWSCQGEIKSIQATYSPHGWVIDSDPPEDAHIDGNVLHYKNHQLPFWQQGPRLSLVYEGENFNLFPYSPPRCQRTGTTCPSPSHCSHDGKDFFSSRKRRGTYQRKPASHYSRSHENGASHHSFNTW